MDRCISFRSVYFISLMVLRLDVDGLRGSRLVCDRQQTVNDQRQKVLPASMQTKIRCERPQTAVEVLRSAVVLTSTRGSRVETLSRKCAARAEPNFRTSRV